MYKVLLVEDEIFVLESLKAMVKWEEYGFSIVGEAHNGVEAYERIETLRPDLVFSDIIMPRMNGLELIQRVSSEFTGILFVIVSGYAEFAYAQKVFNYGGIGYCLKPFDANEIGAVLNKARGMLERNSKVREASLLELLNEKQGDAGVRIEAALTDMGLGPGKGKGYLALVSIGDPVLGLPGGLEHVSFRTGTQKHAYIIAAADKQKTLGHIEGYYPPGVKGIGISREFQDFGLLRERIAEAELLAYKYFMTGKPGVYEEDVPGHEQMNELLQALDKTVEKREPAAVKRSIDKAGDFFSLGLCSARQVYRFYNTVMLYLARVKNYDSDEYSYNYEELFSAFGDLKGLMEYLKKYVDKEFGSGLAIPKDNIRNETFGRIISYINENYLSDINLQSIARDFLINPSYISQLFKKELDTTYTDYVTNLRIRFAENLLRTTNLQISEISEKAGYDDYFYFVKVFKKATGKTPSEYKQSSGK